MGRKWCHNDGIFGPFFSKITATNIEFPWNQLSKEYNLSFLKVIALESYTENSKLISFVRISPM